MLTNKRNKETESLRDLKQRKKHDSRGLSRNTSSASEFPQN